jgi:hypothetical protein
VRVELFESWLAPLLQNFSISSKQRGSIA